MNRKAFPAQYDGMTATNFESFIVASAIWCLS